ncbi:MAG: hypothetical protein NUW37_12055 [Planctomycetes bacterium]|nr:hypothetical protein [Planctomycetota bacterium]
MKSRYNFSKAVRGKIYREDAGHYSPIYLDTKLDERLKALADLTGISVQELATKWLERDIENVDAATPEKKK